MFELTLTSREVCPFRFAGPVGEANCSVITAKIALVTDNFSRVKSFAVFVVAIFMVGIRRDESPTRCRCHDWGKHIGKIKNRVLLWTFSVHFERRKKHTFASDVSGYFPLGLVPIWIALDFTTGRLVESIRTLKFAALHAGKHVQPTNYTTAQSRVVAELEEVGLSDSASLFCAQSWAP